MVHICALMHRKDTQARQQTPFFILILMFLLINTFGYVSRTPAGEQSLDPNIPPAVDPNTLPALPYALETSINPNQPQEPKSSKETKEIPEPVKIQRPLGFYEYKFYKSFGGFGSGQGSFELPVDIGIARDDNIYVLDRKAGRIQKFDAEGRFEDEWETFSIENDNQPQTMDKPQALCVDETVIYVADTRNNRILQFDTRGNLITMWGSFGSREGQFHYPADITVDNHDNCYILDSKNLRIQCLDDEGAFKFQWGGFGSGPGSFLKPTRLAYDPSGFGYIWVIEGKDGRIKKFDLNGDFISAFTPKDKDGKPLPNPADLCFDTQGFIFITDSMLHKVFKYNNDGGFIQCWGEEGKGPGQFKGPQGIAIDSDDRVLVVDSGNYRIQIFQQF